MENEYRVEEWKGPDSPDPDRLRRMLESDGYSAFEWSDRPGAVYPPHSHGEDQSHCVVSGSLELEVEGYGKVVLSPGDRDYMPAGTVHSARVIGDKPVVYLIGRRAG